MGKTLETPDQSKLLSMLEYDPETGRLKWLPRSEDDFRNGGHQAAHNVAKWNGKHAGKQAFTATKGDGYKHGSIFGRNYSAHRIIWKMVHGVEADEIDHINGDRSDNRLENLRSIPRAINLKNVARHTGRTNPGTGVRKHKTGKWQAYLCADGKFISLGCHDTPEAALAIRKAAEVAYGFHPNHGREAT